MSRIRLYGAQFGMALLLSLALWTYVSFTTNPTSTRIVTTTILSTGLDDNLVLVDNSTGLPEQLTQSTTITLSGPKDDLAQVVTNDVHATIDLSEIGPGLNQVPVTTKIDQTGIVRATELKPAEITVRIARKLVVTMPVTVTQEGQPPFSFTTGDMTQSASEAVVSGPEDLVQQVTEVTAVVNAQGQTRDIEETLSLQAVDEKGGVVEGVTLNPDRVRVKVTIVAQVDVQQISVVPDVQGQPASGYAVSSIDWTPKIVEVFTSGSVTGTLTTDTVDITGATGDITRTVSLSQPGNVITRPGNVPVTVRVSIIPIAVRSQLPLIVPISPIGLDKRYVAVAQPSYVQITLAGMLDRLTKITADQVPATVDLAGYGPGAYTLPVQVAQQEGLQVVASSDPNVRIIITERVATPTPAPESSTVPTPTP